MKINEGSCDPSEATDSATPTHPIAKTESTNSTKPLPPHQQDHSYMSMSGPGNYPVNQQTSHMATPTSYSSPKQPQAYPPPPSSASSSFSSHQHSTNLSQPGPSQMMSSQPLPSTSQGSHSQGHTHYPTHPNIIGPARDGVGPGGGGGGSPYNAYPRPKMSYENIAMASAPRHSHLTHTHPSLPHPSQSKYGGIATQGGVAPLGPTSGYQQGGGGVDPRERSHDIRDRSHDGHHHGISGGGGPMEYPPMARSPYSMGAGPRRKTISPASVSVAHDAAASGDIATLVRKHTRQTHSTHSGYPSAQADMPAHLLFESSSGTGTCHTIQGGARLECKLGERVNHFCKVGKRQGDVLLIGRTCDYKITLRKIKCISKGEVENLVCVQCNNV